MVSKVGCSLREMALAPDPQQTLLRNTTSWSSRLDSNSTNKSMQFWFICLRSNAARIVSIDVLLAALDPKQLCLQQAVVKQMSIGVHVPSANHVFTSAPILSRLVFSWVEQLSTDPLKSGLAKVLLYHASLFSISLSFSNWMAVAESCWKSRQSTL